MMKCRGEKDGRPCETDLPPEVEICPECGTHVPKVSVLEKPKDTVACPGTDEGNPCNNRELIRGKKFCDACGWRVNQSIFKPGSRVCGAVDGQGTRCTGVVEKHETICPICKQIKEKFDQMSNRMDISNSGTATAQTSKDDTVQAMKSPHGEVEIPQQVGQDTSSNLFLSSLSGSGKIQVRSSASDDSSYSIPLSPENKSQTPQCDHDTTPQIDSTETLIPMRQALQDSSLFKLNEKPKSAETKSPTSTATNMDVDDDHQPKNRASDRETDTEDSEDSSSDGSIEVDEKQHEVGRKRKKERKHCDARMKKKKKRERKREKKREKNVKSSSSISTELESNQNKTDKSSKVDISTEQDNSIKNNSSGSASSEPTSKKGKSEESNQATTSNKNVQSMFLEKIYGRCLTAKTQGNSANQIIESAALLKLQQQQKQKQEEEKKQFPQMKQETPEKMDTSGSRSSLMNGLDGPFKPRDKQIETKTPDGRRRITPIFLCPQPDVNGSAIPAPYSAISSSIKFTTSKDTSKIRVDNEDTTMVRVKNVPLSAFDGQIKRDLEHRGCEVINMYRERLRVDGFLTNCETGDRMVTVKKLETPLPPIMLIGSKYRAVIKHRGQPNEKITCGNCLETGHYARDCGNERVCRECKQPGHIKSECPTLWDSETNHSGSESDHVEYEEGENADFEDEAEHEVSHTYGAADAKSDLQEPLEILPTPQKQQGQSELIKRKPKVKPDKTGVKNPKANKEGDKDVGTRDNQRRLDSFLKDTPSRKSSQLSVNIRSPLDGIGNSPKKQCGK